MPEGKCYTYQFLCQNFGGKYGAKNAKRVERYKGNTPEMGMLTAGCEVILVCFCLKIDPV